jgi:16S rRNA (guanine966-N2)-methyltransferase
VALPTTVDADDVLGDGHVGKLPAPRQTDPVRVVSGSLRGRRLEVPEGDHTRPTSDRVREAVFNSLFSLGVIDDAVVLDAFAGSGALGIEALSRGAASVTFVENDRRALEALRRNLDALELVDRSTVIAGDGAAAIAAGEPVDLVLLDPPYDREDWPELLAGITNATVVIESDREVELPSGWLTYRVRRYGGTVVTLAAQTPIIAWQFFRNSRGCPTSR